MPQVKIQPLKVLDRKEFRNSYVSSSLMATVMADNKTDMQDA